MHAFSSTRRTPRRAAFARPRADCSPTPWFAPLAVAIAVAGAWVAPAAAGEWSVEKTERGVVVKLDGRLMTEYRFESGGKPVMWPLIGPDERAMTRAYPVAEAAGEERDHLHHRSFWFALGIVNGVNFWTEGKGRGVIRHREIAEASGGERATLVTKSDWLNAAGEKQCEDERRFVFRDETDKRVIDVTIRLIAAPGEVKFGDTKEGALALRVASTIRGESKLGGLLINSVGQTDAAAFGKRAEWCDFHGPVDGQTVGIALLVHPKSFRAPNCWFVRPYGLLAVNPFGDHELSGSGDGAYTLPKGESLAMRCRVILHRGDEKEAHIAEAFLNYAQEP